MENRDNNPQHSTDDKNKHTAPDDLPLQVPNGGVGVGEVGEQAFRGWGRGAVGFGAHKLDVVLRLHPHLLPSYQHLQCARTAGKHSADTSISPSRGFVQTASLSKALRLLQGQSLVPAHDSR